MNILLKKCNVICFGVHLASFNDPKNTQLYEYSLESVLVLRGKETLIKYVL
jgi:hypothetical protein